MGDEEQVQTITREEQQRLARIYIDDAIVTKMYCLQRVASKNYHDAMSARELANAINDQRVAKANRRAAAYKLELRRVNRAHRLLVLEHKELKRKYDASLTPDAVINFAREGGIVIDRWEMPAFFNEVEQS